MFEAENCNEIWKKISFLFFFKKKINNGKQTRITIKWECISKMVWKSDFICRWSQDRYFEKPKWKTNQYFISNFSSVTLNIMMYQNKSNALQYESQCGLHCVLPVETSTFNASLSIKFWFFLLNHTNHSIDFGANRFVYNIPLGISLCPLQYYHTYIWIICV